METLEAAVSAAAPELKVDSETPLETVVSSLLLSAGATDAIITEVPRVYTPTFGSAFIDQVRARDILSKLALPQLINSSQ